MTTWQSVAVVTVAILVALLSHRVWLPSLLATLRGYEIDAVWAGKTYSVTVKEAEDIIAQQNAIILDRKWGFLRSIPGVLDVKLAPVEVAGEEMTALAISVLVEKKKPLYELPKEHIIPRFIGDVRVDVVEQKHT